MSKCILCTNRGEERKYFLENEPMCDIHYIGYLEFLLDDSEEEVTAEDANNAYEGYKLSMELKPRPLSEKEKEEKERKEQEDEEELHYSVAPSPFGMGM